MERIVWDPVLGDWVEEHKSKRNYVSNSSRRQAKVRRLAKRDGWACRWCGIPLDPDIDPNTVNQLLPDRRYPTIDHLTERKYGGSDLNNNCVLSCGPCNNIRSNQSKKRKG